MWCWSLRIPDFLTASTHGNSHENSIGSWWQQIHPKGLGLYRHAQIERKLGSTEVTAYQAKQADLVLNPIQKFLDKHAVNYRCIWVAGTPASQIIDASKRERVQMIVMGSHGHGLLSRMFIGSVAQRVLADSEIPTLLVK